jgi:hypothetical protein
VIGAVLLVLTPERVFSALVPLLLGFATVLFAYAGRISTWLAARAATRGNVRRFTHSPAVVLPVSVYGGYFGAGLGVLMLGVLSVGTAGNYRSANVTKNLVTGLNSATATVIFAAQGVVSWPATLLMMAGTLVGGLIGARLAQVMPNHAAAQAGRVRWRAADGRLCLALLALTLLRQLDEPANHRALGIGHRVDRSEMVCPGDGLEAGLRAGLAPGLGDDPALAQELARFQTSDHRIEDAALRCRPEQRRDPPRLGLVEPQILRHGDLNQWREIEHAGDRVGRRAPDPLVSWDRAHATRSPPWRQRDVRRRSGRTPSCAGRCAAT